MYDEYEEILTQKERVNAISWAALQAGESYGKFVLSIGEKDLKDIYYEYSKIMKEKKDEEADRLKAAKRADRASSKSTDRK